MIKFFRKIRYELMEKGKTGKYFKYAIGEIILVVIGILIALQINNWNETQNEKKIEMAYLQNMLEDLNNDIKIYDAFEKSNLIIYGLTDSITQNIKKANRKSRVSDLSFWTRKVTMEWLLIHPIERTYEQMKSSGHLRLIKDKKVANSISDYYSSLSQFDGYNEAGMLWAAEYVKAIGKIFDAELLLKIMRTRKKQVANPSDLLTEDPIVINELINSLQYFNGALSLGEGVSITERERANNLIQLISEKYHIE